MSLRIVLIGDGQEARTQLSAVDWVAAVRRLDTVGCELATGAAVDAAGRAGAGIISARLTAAPRPWYDWDAGLEATGLEELVAGIVAAAEAGLVPGLFESDACAWRAAIAERLGSPAAPDDRFWLFGAGHVGRQVASLATSLGRPPQGFLDNDARLQGAVIDGLPVRAPEALDPLVDRVVLCTGGGHAALQAQLARVRVPLALHLSEYLFLLGCPTEPERGYGAGVWEDRFRYVGLLGRLADEESRRALAGVLAHRLTFAGEPLAEIAVGDQWLIPEVFTPSRDHVFVDGGAYDGDSAAEFLAHNGGPCSALHLFEPDEALRARAAARLGDTPGVVVHEAGLSDRTGFASFAGTGGMDGALSDAGATSISVAAVDDTVPDPVSYLKLDVEGAELAALEGARHTILERRPVLAVAAYHRSHDLWRVPAWIDGLDAGYSLYLRHHTELAFETVVYGSPVAARRR